ncbi:MAG: hypothetical protein H0V95_11030 [Actinobacteria bacterium]|nr:hypothetical protein [Actinomycetota bacterium]
MKAFGARCLWAIALVVLAVGLWDRPAQAGGSVWKFDAERYRPGERAFAWAAVAWEHSPALGTPEDGPYFVYLAPSEPGTPNLPWPPIPSGAVRVAEVVVDLEPYDAGGVKYGPHHATIEFTVPDLPAGQYTVMHCNSPCTTTFGDVTFGLLIVDPISPPAENAPPETSPPETSPPETSPPETSPPETSPPETSPPSTSDALTEGRQPANRSDLQPSLIGGASLGLIGGAVGSAVAWHRLSGTPATVDDREIAPNR